MIFRIPGDTITALQTHRLSNIQRRHFPISFNASAGDISQWREFTSMAQSPDGGISALTSAKAAKTPSMFAVPQFVWTTTFRTRETRQRPCAFMLRSSKIGENHQHKGNLKAQGQKVLDTNKLQHACDFLSLTSFVTDQMRRSGVEYRGVEDSFIAAARG